MIGLKKKKVIFNDFVRKRIKPNIILYIFLLPALVYAAIFMYRPMYGLILAFKKFNAGLGITGSPWIGFHNFERFFNSYIFWQLLSNTLKLSVYGLLAGMPFPILFALMLNYCSSNKFKKIVQTVTYAPHFISVVVLIGMMLVFLSPRFGIINTLLDTFGFEKVPFMMEEGWFRPLFIISGIWQNFGFSAIIYIAVLSGVSPELHEAAIVDGASKVKRIINIDIPELMPTFVILMILSVGNLMHVGFEKVLLMQNSANAQVSNIIGTYVYQLGVMQGEFSYTTAIGFFNNFINFILLIIANTIARKLTKTSII